MTQTAAEPLFDVPRPPVDCLQVEDDAIRNGEVFTRRWVVDSILDWVGYDPERDLAELRIVDPACGQGAFVVAIAERVSASCRKHDRPITDAIAAVRAFDLLEEHAATSRHKVAEALLSDGWASQDVDLVVHAWLRQADYLLENSQEGSDFVVGNPPYIRLEDVPFERMLRYRQNCSAMVGRADIYVGFFELALRSLNPGGRLGFICADRWMRNQYGRELRAMIEREYAVEACISMHDVDVFEDQVSAYPAITVIARMVQESAIIVETTSVFDAEDSSELLKWAAQSSAEPQTTPSYRAARLPTWFRGETSWPTGSPGRLAMLEDLNLRFMPLQDELTGTRVGIGVATGADAVFITTSTGVVERDRLLPLAMVRDIKNGELEWSGNYLVNPWNEVGALVDLRDFPLLSRYFASHEEALRGRHVGRRQPQRWYRTIDKVDHRLRDRPKLLVPDMKTFTHPVLDPGGHYPHHNLYYIVSDTWDLRVLGGLLLSRIAEAFIEAYAVKMRGGTLRFQAQYLRRIRVPSPEEISTEDQAALALAFESRDRNAATKAALRVYGLTDFAE